MAQLLRELAVSGSRLSDGTPNASGLVFLYAPGTTTVVPGYTSGTLAGTWATTGGGIQLDAAGKAAIWLTQAVDVVIASASGQTIATLLNYNGTPAPTVEVQNAGYTGTVTDPATGNQTQAAGGATTLDAALTSATESFGGLDFTFLESGGGTQLNYQDVVRSIHLTPQMFGAKGDNLNDDTTAIQSALNRLQALGGGILFLPPGAGYKTSSVLTIPTSNITISGAGNQKSIIRLATGSTAITWNAKTNIALRDIGMTGGGVSFGGVCQYVLLDRVYISTSAGYAVTVSSGTVLDTVLRDCNLTGITGSISLTGASRFTVSNTSMLGGTNNIFAAGTTGGVYVCNRSLFGSSTNGIIFDATSSGTDFQVVDCPSIASCTTPFNASAISNDPGISQRGNNYDYVLTNTAVGASVTPASASNGVVIQANAGGAGTVTVNAPTPLLGANTRKGRLIVYELINASGGAVTWTLDTTFRLNTSILTTDGVKTLLQFFWDGNNLRELCRQTTTL